MTDKELIEILLKRHSLADKSGVTYDPGKRTIFIEVLGEDGVFSLTRNELADEIGDEQARKIINWINE